jgi:hypothetical protein
MGGGYWSNTVVIVVVVAIVVLTTTTVVVIAIVDMLEVLGRAGRMGTTVRPLILLRNCRRRWLTSQGDATVGISVDVIVRKGWGEEVLRLVMGIWREFHVNWVRRHIRWDI